MPTETTSTLDETRGEHLSCFAHVTLSTTQEDVYHHTLHFYGLLGFLSLKQSPLARGGCETWLHLHPHPRPLKEVDALPELALHVVLLANEGACAALTSDNSTMGSPEPEMRTASVEREMLTASHAIELKEHPALDLRGFGKTSKMALDEKQPLSLTLRFPSDRIQELETTLSHQSYPFLKLKSEDTSVSNGFELSLRDPLGNGVVVTPSASPYTLSQWHRNPRSPKALGSRTLLASIPHLNVQAESLLPLPLDGLLSGKRRKLAILTSGGDAPGMNAAVRAVVRVALIKGCEPFAVMEGYQGLVEGGEKLKPMVWDDVQGILAQGGTIIGTARSTDFRTREGRLKAAKNMVERGIDSLIVVGGDGSLTGADLLRSEWTGLLQELVQKQLIQQHQADESNHLHIVGMVGSIDNDMASTDITIGAVSSLHRICEAVDSISSTAMSHQRAFVIEVMGRNCGWLALMAGIATGADYLFIPESPPAEHWEEKMCKTLQTHREMGKRKSIIIVAEGAIDRQLNPIRAEYLKDLISTRLKVDTRVTTLGHVQRGGSPAAFDRYLGTIQGVEAVQAVLSATPDSEAPLIGMSENKVTVKPLMKAVEETRQVAEAIKRKDFETAMALRDPAFQSSFEAFIATIRRSHIQLPPEKRLRIAIVHVGAPAGGMNAATRAAVRYALNRGHTPLVINNGFAGLIAGDIRPISWMDVEMWTVTGGSSLGTNRTQPEEDFGLCAYQIQKNNIQALVIIGGFEAFTALRQLSINRKTYPSFCIPIIQIPATISNNVPGTEFSLGCDTALNVVVEACDRIRQSAYSSRKRVFVVEVQGGQCGFLATMAGLSCGATCAYIPEEGINLRMIARDCEHLIRQFTQGANQGRVIIRNEDLSETYTTEVISSVLKEEGRGVFDSRSSILGHIQQGGVPSPLDRVRATRLAVRSVQWIEEIAFPSLESAKVPLNMSAIEAELDFGSEKGSHRFHLLQKEKCRLVSGGIYTSSQESTVVIGIQGTSIVMTPVEQLIHDCDFKRRKSKKAWWLELNNLIRVLAKYGYEE